jgi:predicted dehydrogenase
MKKVRVGVVGTGGMGQGHCRALQELEESKLTAVCDIDPNTLKEVSKRHKVPGFDNYKKLIDSGLCDAIVIGTPHYPHPLIGKYAFQKGLHVLSEKPIAVTVKAGDEFIAAARKAEKKGLKFQVMFQMRSDPVNRKAKSLVEQGVLGEIYRTELVMGWYRSQAYYDSGTWRATWKGEGAGVLINQAPHHFDLFTWIGGLPSRVMAITKTSKHNIEVEDEASALIEYPNGATGFVHCSTNEFPGTDTVLFCGDKGKLDLSRGKLQLWEIDPPIMQFTRGSTNMWGGPKAKKKRVRLQDRERGHRAILKNFCRAILHDEPLLSPGVDTIGGLELANAILLSGHKGGKPVKVPVDRQAVEDLLAHLRKQSKKKSSVRIQRVTDPAHA